MPKNPHADFAPALEGYSGQGKFRFWCQMALPLTYDDSLSYYELLCKVVNYLNNTIEDVADVETNVSRLSDAYTQLQNYVNDYFDDLDVEAELRNVLDAMAEDGTLDDLLDPLVQDHLPSVVDEQIDEVVADQINDAVAGQIDDVVAEQLPPLVEEGIPGEVSDWLTENVDPVGSAVVVDSSLTISGAAADAKVTGDELTNLKTQLIDSTGMELITFTPGGYIGTGGSIGSTVSLTPTTSDGWSYAIIENCKEGDTFLINVTGGQTPRAWAFLTEENKLASVAASSATIDGLILVAPSNGKKLILNDNSGKNGSYKKPIITSVEDLYNNAETLASNLVDLEKGIIHLSPSDFVRGELQSNGTMIEDRVYIVSSNKDLQFDRPIKITVGSDYTYAYCAKTGENTYSIGSYISYDTFVLKNVPFRLKIKRAVETWGKADIPAFVSNIKINSAAYGEIKENSASIEKLKSGRELINGQFTRGSLNSSGETGWGPYRICSKNIIQYSKDVTLKAESGFRFGIMYFDENDDLEQDIGWQTQFSVPANQKFKITIARVTEDSTENVNVFEFYTKVSVNTDLLDYVNSINTSLSAKDFPIFNNGKVKLIAHAGYKANYPENTIESFIDAGKEGYWCIESDVQETSDGYFIMMHDTTLDRTTNGTGNISDHTLAEIEALHIKDHDDMKIPTLEDFLAVCKWYGCVPMIEIKSSVAIVDYGNLINAALNCGFTEKNIIFCGSKYSLPTFKAINEIITYFSIYQNGGGFNFADELNVCRGFKNTGMSWDIGLTLSKAQVEAAHDANVLIGTFQITNTSGMFDAFSLGVDWCSTDTVTPSN